MWHVDEGALHAYLDGALDEYPAAEARKVREHLETCAECTARLAAERRVRDEAESILGLAAPEVAVPTFEELRAYVKAREPARTTVSVRLYRMGWAASVALALGTGWILRGGVPEPTRAPTSNRAAEMEAADAATAAEPAANAIGAPSEASPPQAAQERSLPVDGARSSATDGATAGAGGSALEERQVDAARAPTQQVEPRREIAERVVARPAAPSTGALADASDVTGASAASDADAAASKTADDTVVDPAADAFVARQQGAAPEPTPPAAAADAAAVAGRARADTSTRDADGARRAAPEQRLTSATTALAPIGTLGAGGAAGAAPPDAPATSAVPAADESVALVVPGLDVLDVLPVGQGTTFAGMRALQRLEAGDTLEIVHLPESVDPTSLPPLREGWRELLVPRGSGWLVMRAPVSEAVLLELLQRLDGGR